MKVHIIYIEAEKRLQMKGGKKKTHKPQRCWHAVDQNNQNQI